MVALAQVGRLQDVEVERILDLPVPVAGRELDVDDDIVLGVARGELAERVAGDLLVLSDACK